MKKFPPIEKILEAYTAIADGHVKLENDQALVTSSNEAKTYTVTFHDNIYTSNDNASYWQGYLGYPGIAVLMLQGKLPYDKELAQQFAGVDWNKVNQEYKRNYAQAADAVMTAKGIDKKKAETELHHVYNALKQLPIIVKRESLRPPKAN
ncbi:hypothetical protein BBP12_02360 [Limosilactobacillus reuteri]|nr:hypothetical protein BBP10_05415 [Limosilactobacillus reuteri]OCW65979.1 hypothetical protein BBP11_00130 [Limosilactobacillus reuteri]OCW66600.1 hypothetical protein BBP12_02360 [Limosilactobacillus reuteri]OCW69240.1 hypothetical protein BBP13_06675 [Limosilactobacillus reuteri]OCW70453.1 hypothetical protein BBP14_10535 [Limosilactobacillus reuteri]